jgi:hypothetical protein
MAFDASMNRDKLIVDLLVLSHMIEEDVANMKRSQLIANLTELYKAEKHQGEEGQSYD